MRKGVPLVIGDQLPTTVAPTVFSAVLFVESLGRGLCTRESFNRCVQRNVPASRNNARMHYKQTKRPKEAKYYKTNNC